VIGPDIAISESLRWIDLTGVAANALLGGVLARAERLDPVGFGVPAIADETLDRAPVEARRATRN
jgi:hypothetical protein